MTESTTFVPGFKRWIPLGVMCLAILIILIDTTLLNVSLEVIIEDLHTDLQSLEWVISAYSLILAALTITGGRMGDLFGRKRMFIIGAALFAFGSLMASLSHSVATMMIGEAFIEGIGAALMMPSTASLLVTEYRGRDRALAFGVWGGMAAAGAAIGPIVGGYLATAYSWRWGFRLNIIVALLLIAGSVFIHESYDTKEKPTLDWFGVLLSSAALAALVFGSIEASTYGWFFAKQSFHFASFVLPGPFSVVPYAFVLGVVLFGFFFLHERAVERRGKTPLVSFGMFRNLQFSSAVTTIGVLLLGQAGIFLLLPIFLQAVHGLSPFATGLSLLPLSGTLLIMSPVSGFLARIIEPRRMVQAGFLFDFFGMLLLRTELTPSTTGWDLIPSLMLIAIGMGLIIAQISNIALSAVSHDYAGEASGLLNTFRQVGRSFGTAIIGSLILTFFASHAAAAMHAATNIPADLRASLVERIAQSSDVAFGGLSALGSIPAAFRSDIARIITESLVVADRQAIVLAAFFIVAGFVVSLTLPKMEEVEA